MVTDADALDVLADPLDDTCSLVSENARARVLRRTVDGVPVGMADAAGPDADEHLLRARVCEVELRKSQRPAGPFEDDAAHFHAVTPLRRLQHAELLDGDVAAHQVLGLDLDERRLGLLADRAELARAAGMEDASGGRRRGAWDVALQADPVASAAVDRRHRRQQRLRVRVVRAVEHDIRRTELLEASEVEDGDPVRDVTDDAEVVRDEEVRDPLLRLELDEQIEDRRLHGDVEGRRRLVADDELRIAGERARDGDALLEAAGELHRFLGRAFARSVARARRDPACGLLRLAPLTPASFLSERSRIRRTE